MANSTPSFPGQKAGTGDVRALYLDLFGGEILNQYEVATIMRPLQRMFQLEAGKSLRMPFIGQATANYHVPGTELTGGSIQGDEIVLTPDDQLIADVFLSDIDEKLAHFDARFLSDRWPCWRGSAAPLTSRFTTIWSSAATGWPASSNWA